MTVQQIQQVMRANPFIPFRIHYPGGEPVEVPHADYISLSHSGRIAFVSLPDDRLMRVDVALITAIENLEITQH